jgi:hypothetical protein
MERRQAMLAALGTVVLPRVAEPSDNERDGNYWQGLTRFAKTNYVVGFLDGIELGHRFSYWFYQSIDKGAMTKTSESYQFYVSRFMSGVTVRQLTDGLDSFFQDYRNRRINICDGVWVTLNAIAGTPQAKTDEVIESLRRQAR